MADPRHTGLRPPTSAVVQDAELAEADFELVMLLVDGELAGDPTRRAQAEALLATSPLARAIADDWTSAKAALCEAIVEVPAAALSKSAQAELGHVRGRVMAQLVGHADSPSRAPAESDTRALPAAPDRAVAPQPQRSGLVAWLRRLGFGKVSLAVGLAAAAAIWLLVSATGQMGQAPDDAAGGALAVAPRPAVVGADAEPSVIIEDMEIESGTVMVRTGEGADDATIIWHFQPEDQGAG